MGGWGSLDGDDGRPPDSARAIAADNVLQLFDYAQTIIDVALTANRNAPIAPDVIQAMHAHAMRKLLPDAGSYRGEGPVRIEGSRHVPPPHTECPALVEEMCALLARETDRDPVWLASYALWRLNS